MDIKEEKTQELYSDIHPLAIGHYERFKHILSSRYLEEQDIFFEGKVCLDAGCGLGRTVSSMKAQKADMVVGLDIAIENLKRAMFLNKNEKKIYFLQANLLKLPFKDNVFDFVHCSGVLHHTIAPYAGFLELTRCLKNKGAIYLALYGKMGIISFVISIGRLVVKMLPYKIGKRLLSIIVQNKIFLSNLLDVLYVPILVRYTRDEVKQWFKNDYHEPVFIEGKVDNIYDSKLLKSLHPSCSTFGKRVQKLLYGEGWLRIKGIKR